MTIEDDRIKAIIDRKYINITFNSKSLNREQKTKINNYSNKNIYLLDNYYYNKLEIKYEIELLEKLKSIIISHNNDDNNRIDLYLFKVLINILFDVKYDLKTIIKKNYSINIIINQIELKIKEEKLILENLLLSFHKNNSELNERFNDLNKLDREILKKLLNNNHYFIYIREYLIKLLNSILILVNTYIILIINYGLIRFQENDKKILFTIFLDLELKNAINLFENVKESIIDNNDYNKNLKIQKRYYYNLINSLNKNNNNIQSYLINIINDNDDRNDNEIIKKYYKIIENDIKETEKLLKLKNKKKNNNYINFFKIINFRKKKIKEVSNSDILLNERNQNGICDI